jgi:Protein of unknown function (DUF1097)
MKKPPVEIVASFLAVTTIVMALPPYNLPPWALFVAWAGTFAAGGPKPEVLKKIWPVMPIGSLCACSIVLGFACASHYFIGTPLIIAQMVILFCLNTVQMLLARIPRLGLTFVAGMFFGFASYFATFFGGFGPNPHSPFAVLGVVILMNALGPLYAWLTVRLAAPYGQASTESVSKVAHVGFQGHGCEDRVH